MATVEPHNIRVHLPNCCSQKQFAKALRLLGPTVNEAVRQKDRTTELAEGGIRNTLL